VASSSRIVGRLAISEPGPHVEDITTRRWCGRTPSAVRYLSVRPRLARSTSKQGSPTTAVVTRSDSNPAQIERWLGWVSATTAEPVTGRIDPDQFAVGVPVIRVYPGPWGSTSSGAFSWSRPPRKLALIAMSNRMSMAWSHGTSTPPMRSTSSATPGSNADPSPFTVKTTWIR
jgi:hypothetical protein